VNAWLTPVIFIAFGILSVLLARWRKARWYGYGSWLIVAGGIAFAIASIERTATVIWLYMAVGLLGVSAVCMIFSIVKREMRVTLD
jgi:hypothetical protein